MRFLFKKSSSGGMVFDWKILLVILVLIAVALILIWFLVFYDSGPKEGKLKDSYSVGILSGLSYISRAADGFRAGMEELGYVEGENIFYDIRETDFDMAVYREVLQDFVDNEVDLVLSFPTEASLEAKEIVASAGIPVVFTVANIEKVDLIDSVQRPGGNITGVRYPGPDIALKRFEIMEELAPGVEKILIPYQRGYTIVESQLDVLYPEAERAGVEIIEAPVAGSEELSVYLSNEIDKGGVKIDAVLFLAEPLAVEPGAFSVICGFARGRGIPLGGAYAETEDGCKSIFGVHVNDFESGKQAAPLAGKILSGKSAGTIPVVSSESYFQLNYSEAERLGLNLSEGLVASADEVIR